MDGGCGRCQQVVWGFGGSWQPKYDPGARGTECGIEPEKEGRDQAHDGAEMVQSVERCGGGREHGGEGRKSTRDPGEESEEEISRKGL